MNFNKDQSFTSAAVAAGLILGFSVSTQAQTDWSTLEYSPLLSDTKMMLGDPVQLENNGKNRDAYLFRLADFEDELDIELKFSIKRPDYKTLVLFDVQAYDDEWNAVVMDDDLDVDYCRGHTAPQHIEVPKGSRYLILMPKVEYEKKMLYGWCVIFRLGIPYVRRFKPETEYSSVVMNVRGFPEPPHNDQVSKWSDKKLQVHIGLGVQTYFNSFKFAEAEERVRVESSISRYMGLDLRFSENWYSRSRLGAYDVPSYDTSLGGRKSIKNSPPVYRGFYLQTGALYRYENWYLGGGIHYQFGQKIAGDGPRYELDSTVGAFLSAEYRYKFMHFELEYRKLPQTGPDGTRFSADSLGFNFSLDWN